MNAPGITLKAHASAASAGQVAQLPKGLAIVYGWLGENWSKGLGRGRLMWSLARMLPVILLDQGASSSEKEPHVDQLAPNLYVLRNAMRLRYSRIGKRIAPIAAWLDGRPFHRALRRAGFDNYIYWLSANDPRMLLSMSLDRLVYDCIDPCFLPQFQKKFDRNEAAIAAKARMVFCTAHVLHQRMLKLNPRSFILPNACDIETYHACQSPETPLPPLLAGRRHPFIGYMGTVDWRFDAATVTAVARQRPECTFVIVGRVNQDQECNVRELRSLPNVVIAGAAGYDEGHAYAKAFDLGIIPFIPGPMNDAINAVKSFMYLAAGKPIVSTWLAECVRNPLVKATHTPEEFAEAIRHELASDTAAARQARIAFALEKTLDQRAEQAVDIMREQGVLS